MMNASSAVTSQSDQLNTLTQANIDDFLSSFGIGGLKKGRGLLEAFCRYPARQFAKHMVAFDQQTNVSGLKAASTRTLNRFVRDLKVIGAENIPSHGPLLILSNHPGMTDTLILFSSIPRSDLKIIASKRPFLQALYHVSRQLIYLDDNPSQHIGATRAVIRHLRKGGSILTFPAGDIEPDPASMSGAIEALSAWSQSIESIARLAPETKIVTAIVSGVIWPNTLKHPLTRLRRKPKDREQLAAAIQILAQVLLPTYRPVTTQVVYGQPIYVNEFLEDQKDQGLLDEVATQARHLILRHHAKRNPD